MGEVAPVDLGIAGLGPAVRIGSGGFADVYRARQTHLNREVAVKVLRAAAGDEQARMRFERECHAVGAVSGHPNIVGVHEGGFTADGRAYLVMELCPGGSLSDRLTQRGPFTVTEVIDIGIKIGRALGVAHAAGVVHRDVKPGNILITAYGEPALADFGIARVEGGQQTATGLVTASLAHAAPEVLEGATPSAASDQYSLGSTLYELLTGTPPHFRPGDESVWALMHRVLTEPTPDLRRAGVPEPLASTITRATARHAASRFDRAESLVEALTSSPVAVSSPMAVSSPITPDLRPAPNEATVVGRGDPTWTMPPMDHRHDHRHLPGGGISAPPGDVPAPPRRLRRPVQLGVVLVIASALVTGGGLALNRALNDSGDGTGTDTGDTTGSDTTPGSDDGSVADPVDVVFVFPEAQNGPLDVDTAYPMTVSGGAEGTMFQLFVGSEPVGQPAETLEEYIPTEPGRQTLVVRATTPDNQEVVSDPIETYVIGPLPPAGFRANLASFRSEPGTWAKTLREYDRLVDDGHDQLQLLPSDRFPALAKGWWNLFVPGFGDDVTAARAYCEQYDLAMPTDCFASRFDPEA